MNIYLYSDIDIAKVPTSELGSMINGDSEHGIPSRVDELAVELAESPSWEGLGNGILEQVLLEYCDGNAQSGEFSPIGFLWDNDGIGNPGVRLYDVNTTTVTFTDLPPDAMANIKNLIIAHLIDYCGAHPEQYGNLDRSYNPGW